MSGTYEAKDDSGKLTRVAERKSDKHPEFDGEFKIRCPHCSNALLGWISGWARETKDGRKYLGLAFKHRQKREG